MLCLLRHSGCKRIGKCKKRKAIPVTGHGGPFGCEISIIPHFLENRFTDGVEIASLTRRRTALYPQKDSSYSFLLEAK
jgi:hypothetical protein